MTRKIKIGNLEIGGGSPVTIQSMTNTDTADRQKTAEQIERLIDCGCDIVRLAVSDAAEAEACKEYIKRFKIPLVADIQFDYRLAIQCSELGFAKIRFNPGNIGGEDKVKELVAVCKSNATPIRIGVNGGSLEKDLGTFAQKSEALVESALKHARILEKCGFYDTVLSVKSSDVAVMIDAYRLLSRRCDYPLHLGVTESGAYERGLVKSAIGIGSLLKDGIGDTVRVSLSGDPVQEVRAAKLILQSVGLDKNYCEVISCPTCSRCKYDLLKVVDEVNALTANIKKPLKIAVMGCVVNGPGEAKDADFGVAGGKENAVIFKKGEKIKTVSHDRVVEELKTLIDEFNL